MSDLDREGWLNGWPRSDDWVLIGTGSHCAGCGRLLGVACVVVDDAATLPDADPAWPFNEATCPICRLRALVAEGPEDKLTARLKALRATKGSP